jgi:hypothetical protein
VAEEEVEELVEELVETFSDDEQVDASDGAPPSRPLRATSASDPRPLAAAAPLVRSEHTPIGGLFRDGSPSRGGAPGAPGGGSAGAGGDGAGGELEAEMARVLEIDALLSRTASLESEGCSLRHELQATQHERQLLRQQCERSQQLITQLQSRLEAASLGYHSSAATSHATSHATSLATSAAASAANLANSAAASRRGSGAALSSDLGGLSGVPVAVHPPTGRFAAGALGLAAGAAGVAAPAAALLGGAPSLGSPTDGGADGVLLALEPRQLDRLHPADLERLQVSSPHAAPPCAARRTPHAAPRCIPRTPHAACCAAYSAACADVDARLAWQAVAEANVREVRAAIRRRQKLLTRRKPGLPTVPAATGRSSRPPSAVLPSAPTRVERPVSVGPTFRGHNLGSARSQV